MVNVNAWWLTVVVAVVVIVLTDSVLSENPCCSYPCLHQGICTTKGFHQFNCDCTRTGFYGDLCQHATVVTSVKGVVHISPDTMSNVMTSYKWMWNIINLIPFLVNTVMRFFILDRSHFVDVPSHYESEHLYITLDAASNKSRYARILPPVPPDCPTPMGVSGPKELPDVDSMIKKLFVRKSFRPEVRGSSVLFAYFAQHFTHQFLKTDFKAGPAYTWSGHALDNSHIYGRNRTVEAGLRKFVDGKLRSQLIEDEEFPPLLKDVEGVPMTYPPDYPDKYKFALGHEFYSMLPGLFVYATLWMREHNRICDVMKKVHPEWDDEQLFQTVKLIILGIQIKVVIEEYVQHISNFNFKLRFRPEVMFDEPFQYQTHTHLEFNLVYHWHPLMPDEFQVGSSIYPIKDYFYNNKLVLKHGMHDFIDSMSRQRAGLFGHSNHGPATIHVLRQTILHAREVRVQPMNRYREIFHLDPYKSFEDLTGERKVARELEIMYGDINAMELYVGILVEKKRQSSMFGSTLLEMLSAYSVKGVLANTLSTPHFWKPSTFGGDVGMDLINTATFEKIVCGNMKGPCPLVSFRVPDFQEGDTPDEYKDEL